MAANSRIEWTSVTWNAVTGCTRVSDGCTNCYIETTMPFRVSRRRFGSKETGATTGVLLHPERLDWPVTRWRKPERIFVNSLSDLFHDEVPDEFIAQMWTVMAATPQHTYQILTKRHARMRSVLRRLAWRTPTTEERAEGVRGSVAYIQSDESLNRHLGSPDVLPNVHVGVSVENQKWADVRIPALLETPAAVRWLSCEPLLGPVDLDRRGWLWDAVTDTPGGIHWVVAGGESGPGARPMELDWARLLVRQCQAAEVSVFVKQLGIRWGKDHHDINLFPEGLRVREFPAEPVRADVAR
jgi:protein gp37